MKISGVVITFNEARNIDRCLASLKGVVDELVVVDSHSTDQTEAICTAHNVRFIKQAFLGYVEQKNFALDQCSHDVVLSLDADEALSEQLRQSILNLKNEGGLTADAYEVNRFNNYCGKWIRYGGWYPDRKIRLWDKRKGRWGGTNPHDKVKLNAGSSIARLKGDLLHFAYETVEQHIEQMHKFARIDAQAKYEQGKHVSLLIHIVLNPAFKFVKKYFLQLGFLDGYYGFVFCATASVMNFHKYLRLYELNRPKQSS